MNYQFNPPTKNESFYSKHKSITIFVSILVFLILVSVVIIIWPKNNSSYHLKNDENKNFDTFAEIIDTDKDGLPDEEEVRYNTDLNNPDTDGDGYSDFEEVKNGYNPTGEGRLKKDGFYFSVSDCNKETNQLKKDICLMFVAKTKNDEQICKDINSKSQDGFIKDECYELIAVEKKDHKICEKIKEIKLKDTCYYEVAAYSKPKVCEYIENESKRNSCFYRTNSENQNIENCIAINDIYKKNACFFMVARVRSDYRICNNISNNREMNLCIRFVAEDTNNHSICKTIDNFFFLSRCYEVTDESKLEVGTCEKFKDIEKLECYIQAGRTDLDPSMCENITGYLYENLQNVEDLLNKDHCYFRIAQITKNVELCEKITNKGWYNDCIKFQF
ncbi:hypothetical protein KAI92_03735 [Candidatus Parcubacteria bacterium]|nr:hypothetical protein [Candidatus Parcubacteria bacterium]